MRKLLRKAAKGGPIKITPGALGHDSESEDEDRDEEERLDEMHFLKVRRRHCRPLARFGPAAHAQVALLPDGTREQAFFSIAPPPDSMPQRP